MLKRITPEQVRLGMFIEAIDGEWKGQRFWRNRFLLKRVEDLRDLKASGVGAVVIATDKGKDIVVRPVAPQSRSLPEVQTSRALATIDQAKPLLLSIVKDISMGGGVSVEAAEEVVDQIAMCMDGNSRALIEVTRLKSRDEYTFLHSISVAALMVHLGRAMQMDEKDIKTLALGGLLHDVGKMRLPLEILNKTGKLTEDEMALVRNHPQYSYDLLSKQGDIPCTVLDICLHHHERLDGRGYPNGLSQAQISVPVRLASICDVYDALTSRRAYKKAWSPRDAIQFMSEQHGQFDATLLKKFFSSLRPLFNS